MAPPNLNEPLTLPTRRAAWTPGTPLAWIVFYLVALDLGANAFFAYPKDPRNITPSRLQLYFEYGRAIEGKLARMTRATDEESAPIVASGWLEPSGSTQVPNGAVEGTRPVVTFFGMSHAQLLAHDVARIDDTLAVRCAAAPQAVPTWSFSAYLEDRKRRHSDVVVLTVMTQTIPLLSATAGGTLYFDGAYPYTWPRYYLEDDTLRSVAPPFLSREGYRRHFYDPMAWSRYRDWLTQHDKHYDPLLFRRSALDRSSLARLLRRSYALAIRATAQATAYDPMKGFDRTSEEARVLEALIVEFARLARRDGTIPIVFVVNNLNTSDHAFRLVEPTLSRHGIARLSSHEICPPNEPRNYLPDSHFQPPINLELARAMARLIRTSLADRENARRSLSARGPQSAG